MPQYFPSSYLATGSSGHYHPFSKEPFSLLVSPASASPDKGSCDASQAWPWLARAPSLTAPPASSLLVLHLSLPWPRPLVWTVSPLLQMPPERMTKVSRVWGCFWSFFSWVTCSGTLGPPFEWYYLTSEFTSPFMPATAGAVHRPPTDWSLACSFRELSGG